MDPTHSYSIELPDDTGLVFSQKLDPAKVAYFSLAADSTRRFYRAEVFGPTRALRIAIENPIWN